MMEAFFMLVGVVVGAAIVAAVFIVRRGAAAAELANAQARATMLDEQLRQRSGEIESVRMELDQADRAREAAERQAAVIGEQLAAREKQFAEQKHYLEDLRKQLADTFEALSGKALDRNTQRFLDLAAERFGKIQQAATGDLEKKQQAIDAIVKPIRELLEQQNKAVVEIERKREGAYARIDEQIKQIAAAHSELRIETGRLVTALRKPEVRGRWGEMQLRNVVELAGMTPHCDFAEQVNVFGNEDSSGARPDMTVRLPGGGVIVIDAKVALQAYLDALQPDADRELCLRNHARQTSEHARKLASKKYWDQFERTPRVVVMFVPLESALSAALEVQPDLQSDAMCSGVLIATPISLLGLLRAVAYGWQQEKETENARNIGAVGKELYERLSGLASAIARVGEAVTKTTNEYNRMIGTLESRVLPGARKLKELQGLVSHAEIPQSSAVEIEVRPIIASELQMLPFAKKEDGEVEGDVAPAPEHAAHPSRPRQ